MNGSPPSIGSPPRRLRLWLDQFGGAERRKYGRPSRIGICGVSYEELVGAAIQRVKKRCRTT